MIIFHFILMGLGFLSGFVVATLQSKVLKENGKRKTYRKYG